MHKKDLFFRKHAKSFENLNAHTRENIQHKDHNNIYHDYNQIYIIIKHINIACSIVHININTTVTNNPIPILQVQ